MAYANCSCILNEEVAIVMIWSNIVHCDVDFEVSAAVCQQSAHVVFKKVANSVKFHHVSRLLGQPEFVEFHKEVGVQMVEVLKHRFPFGFQIGDSSTHVENVSFGTSLHQQFVGHGGQIDANYGEAVSEMNKKTLFYWGMLI